MSARPHNSNMNDQTETIYDNKLSNYNRHLSYTNGDSHLNTTSHSHDSNEIHSNTSPTINLIDNNSTHITLSTQAQQENNATHITSHGTYSNKGNHILENNKHNHNTTIYNSNNDNNTYHSNKQSSDDNSTEDITITASIVNQLTMYNYTNQVITNKLI